MGHVLGAKKSYFLIRGAEADEAQGGRASLVLSIPAQEVSMGSPGVETIHVQSPTPPARPLPSVDTYGKMHLSTTRKSGHSN